MVLVTYPGSEYTSEGPLVVLRNGDVVVAASATIRRGVADYRTRSVLIKFSSSGTLKPGFGKGGFAQAPDGHLISDLAIRRGGDLVAVGSGGTDSLGVDYRPEAMVFKKGGGREKSFGKKGIATVPKAGFGALSAVIVQRSGAILAAGSGDVPSYDSLEEGGEGGDALLVRLKPDGKRDRTFAPRRRDNDGRRERHRRPRRDGDPAGWAHRGGGDSRLLLLPRPDRPAGDGGRLYALVADGAAERAPRRLGLTERVEQARVLAEDAAVLDRVAVLPRVPLDVRDVPARVSPREECKRALQEDGLEAGSDDEWTWPLAVRGPADLRYREASAAMAGAGSGASGSARSAPGASGWSASTGEIRRSRSCAGCRGPRGAGAEMSPRARHPGRRRRPRARPSPWDPPRAAPAPRASPGRRRPAGTAAIPNRWRSSARSRSASAGSAIRGHRRRSCHPGHNGWRAPRGTPARPFARPDRRAEGDSRAGRSTRERRRRTAADGSRGLAPPRLRGRRCSSRRSPAVAAPHPSGRESDRLHASRLHAVEVGWREGSLLDDPKGWPGVCRAGAAMKPTAPQQIRIAKRFTVDSNRAPGRGCGSASIARPITRPRPSAGPANRVGPEDRRR